MNIMEALPGGTSLFARAYQQQIGGNLTGKEAISALLAATKRGEVKSDILTVAAQLASQQAQPGIEAASRASQAEQARLQNVTSNLSILASNSGVEEGFARIFRTLNQGLSESGPLVERLANGFNEATKLADDLLLFPQSFIRALEGRDSLVADWLGADATAQLRNDWNSIKESIQAISNIGAPTWLPTLQSISQDIANQFKLISGIVNVDFSKVGSAALDLIKGRFNSLVSPGVSGANLLLRAGGQAAGVTVPQLGLPFGEPTGSGYWSPYRPTGIGLPLIANDPLNEQSFDYPDPFSKALQSQQPTNNFGLPKASLDMKIDVSIKADGFDDLEEKTKSSLRSAVKGFVEEEYSNALLEFSYKGS